MQISSSADNNNNEQSEDNVCMWMIDSENGQFLSCGMQFDAAVDLFNHINNDHIGRRAGGNLCLQCFWLQPSGITTMNQMHNNHLEDQQQQKTELHLSPCGHSVEKRDHIVSHIRVHVVNYKPYECPICAKRFSRSQDCKKHEKTHNSGKGANSGKPSVAGYQNPPHPPTQSPSAEVQMHQSPVYIQRKRQSDFQLTQQQQQQQLSQYLPERRDLGNVMQQFLGSIKRQRIQPRYDSEVRQTLNKIVEYQVANSAPDFNFMLVDGIPTIQEQNLQNGTNPEVTDAVVPPQNIRTQNQQQFHDSQQQQVHSDADLDVVDEIADEMDKDVLHKFLADLYQDLSIDQDVQSPLVDDMNVEVDSGQQQSLVDQQQPQLQPSQPLSINTVIQKLQENPDQSQDPDSPSFVTALDDELYADQQLRMFEQQTVNRQESLEVFMRDVDQAVQQSGVPAVGRDTPDKKVKPLPRSSKGRYPRNSPLPFDQFTPSSAQQDAQQPRPKMVDVIKNTVEVSVSDPSAIIHKQVQFSPSRQQQQYSKKQQQQPQQNSVKPSISRNMSKLPADQTFSTAFKGAEFNPLKPQSSAIAILKSQLHKSATLGGNKKFGASKSLPAHASSLSSAGQQSLSSPSDNQQSIGNVDDGGGPRTIELDFGVMKKVHLRIIEGLLVSLSSSNKK
ncbi:hypothetical protein MIR68_009903 [Amoeboaphelidium protococcarum]|nr:hypothetical protein MIR68_009903 [Amoeboaphelidium protococcarum]